MMVISNHACLFTNNGSICNSLLYSHQEIPPRQLNVVLNRQTEPKESAAIFSLPFFFDDDLDHAAHIIITLTSHRRKHLISTMVNVSVTNLAFHVEVPVTAF